VSGGACGAFTRAQWSAPARAECHAAADIDMTPANFGATVLSASVAFTVTNIDEIVLLALFFTNPRLRPPAVAAGHFLGIAVLIGASVLAGLAAMAVPQSLTRFLGVIPLLLGVYELIQLKRGRDDDDDDDADLDRARTGFASQTLAVAGVALANGSDNLSVYIPMFVAKPDTIPLCVTVFGVLTAALCLLGFALAKNRVIGEKLQRYGKLALPIVLILIGVEILVA
jgi:cadmium resistance protein CadD (predicted permease)